MGVDMSASKKEPEKTYSANYGGARPGSGRKKLSESGRVRIQIAPQQGELEMIDSGAEKAGMNRTRFVVECVKFWTENHR